MSVRNIVQQIEGWEAEMRAVLLELVALPTENPPATTYLPCVEFLSSVLSGLGFEWRRIDVPSPGNAPRAALLATLGPPGPTLYFHGHYDVVPASAADQFAPRVEGDVVFGRGSTDMKSGLVSMLFAARAVAESATPLRGRLGLLLVPDEETGGKYGSQALVQMGSLGRDAIGMLLPEPTSGVVWNASRGALTIEATVRGRAAHVGLAHHGVNAFEKAVSIVNRLLTLKERTRSILLIGGRVEAGSNFNVVPEECTFSVDRRTDPEEDFEDEKRRLLAVFDQARAEGVNVEVRVIQEGQPSRSSDDSELARALAASVEAVTGARPAFELCPGLLETRFYAQQSIPAYAYGPGVLAVAHGPNEFVKVSRMVECAKIYALTALEMLRTG